MREPITTLGTILDTEERRDAIHIAIAPVIAARTCQPGRHIGLNGEGKADPLVETPIGVVDPFLKVPAKPGQRFWLFLYPNTITGLRHQWSHPAFNGDEPAGRISVDDHVAKSKQWIRDHAEVLGLSSDVLMENAEQWLWHKESNWYSGYIVQQGSERWRDNFNPTEFWHNYEVVTGKVVPEDKKQSFYCCTC